MRLRHSSQRIKSVWLVAIFVLLAQDRASAQQGQAGGVVVQGVFVDADGVLHAVAANEKGDRLDKIRRGAQIPRAYGDVAAKSGLRKVSLTRLAKEMQTYSASKTPVSNDMRFLAGLQQIQYVFVYPEEKEVVIAGPAEGWEMNAAGRVIGQTTKRPVLWLDDLAVAMRLFPPGGKQDTVLGCSINPTQEGLQRLNQFMASLGGTIDRRQVNAALVERVRESLGLQDVVIFGVPEDSRMGVVLVEADYRMKMIGIGLEDPRVKGLVSYVSMLTTSSGGTNKLQRWWFVPEYEAIVESTDGNAFELLGQRVRLLSASDAVKASGEVVRKESADPINKRFAETFTKHYPDLAKTNPLFADLQNVFDVIILAAMIQQRGLAGDSAPDLALLYQPTVFSPETIPTPKHVESVVNARWIGSHVAFPTGGGVIVEPTKLISGDAKKVASDGKLLEQRKTVRGDAAAARWWWD